MFWKILNKETGEELATINDCSIELAWKMADGIFPVEIEIVPDESKTQPPPT